MSSLANVTAGMNATDPGMVTIYTTEPLPTKVNPSIVVATIINVTLGAHLAFTILSRVNFDAPWNSRKVFSLSSAAVCLISGAWTSQLIGLHILLMPTATEAWYLTFEPMFVVLSLLVPMLVTALAFLLLGVKVKGRTLHKLTFCGLISGLSYGFMHYSILISLPLIRVNFSFAQTFFSLLISTLLGLSVTLSIPVFRRTAWKALPLLRLLMPLIFGCGLCGMSLLALDGMVFQTKRDVTVEELLSGQKQWEIITIVTPAVFGAILAFTAIFMALSDCANARSKRGTPRRRLIVASAAFTSDGRLMTTPDGKLPFEVVDLSGFHEIWDKEKDKARDVLQELRVEGSIFQWLFALSYNWPTLLPFASRIREQGCKRETGTPTETWHANANANAAFGSNMPASFGYGRASLSGKPTSQAKSRSTRMRSASVAAPCLRTRLLQATSNLAHNLDISMSALGLLYNVPLPIGLHAITAPEDFLHLVDTRTSSTYDGASSTGSSAAADTDADGLMLIFVRRLPPAVATPSEDWARKYASRGFHLSHVRQFAGRFARDVGADAAAVDEVLSECRDYVYDAQSSRPLLRPGQSYVCLMASRRGVRNDWGVGPDEVLVYKFAKYQIPIHNLGHAIQELTPKMRAWIANASGITLSELADLCRKSAAQEHAKRRWSGSMPDSPIESASTTASLHAHHTHSHGTHSVGRRGRVATSLSEYGSSASTVVSGAAEKDAMLKFLEALALALEQFVSSLAFIPELRYIARLYPRITDVDVPCIVPGPHGRETGKVQAHLIMFEVDLSEDAPAFYEQVPSPLSNPDVDFASAMHNPRYSAYYDTLPGFPTPGIPSASPLATRLSSAYTFVPKFLLDTAQTVIYPTAKASEDLKRRLTAELESIFPARIPMPSAAYLQAKKEREREREKLEKEWEREKKQEQPVVKTTRSSRFLSGCFGGTGGAPLVSTFSIDTIANATELRADLSHPMPQGTFYPSSISLSVPKAGRMRQLKKLTSTISSTFKRKEKEKRRGGLPTFAPVSIPPPLHIPVLSHNIAVSISTITDEAEQDRRTDEQVPERGFQHRDDDRDQRESESYDEEDQEVKEIIATATSSTTNSNSNMGEVRVPIICMGEKTTNFLTTLSCDNDSGLSHTVSSSSRSVSPVVGPHHLPNRISLPVSVTLEPGAETSFSSPYFTSRV